MFLSLETSSHPLPKQVRKTLRHPLIEEMDGMRERLEFLTWLKNNGLEICLFFLLKEEDIWGKMAIII